MAQKKGRVFQAEEIACAKAQGNKVSGESLGMNDRGPRREMAPSWGGPHEFGSGRCESGSIFGHFLAL